MTDLEKKMTALDMDKQSEGTAVDANQAETAAEDFVLSETWAQDGKQELLDWIEEQGIYIRE